VRHRVDERPSQAFRRSRRYGIECRRLGLRIRQLRQARELTLEAASAKASLDITHLQKIEAGKVNVTMVTLVRLADGFGIKMADLFVATQVTKAARAR
jgi:transcriptional regulator with XRE-family HTH domain